MNALLSYNVDGLAFQVKFDRWDSLQSNRAIWTWTIRETTYQPGGDYLPDGEVLATGTDLTTVGEDPCEADALRTLGHFLTAWLEAVERDNAGQTAENPDLFPRTILEKVDASTFEQVVNGMVMALGEPRS